MALPNYQDIVALIKKGATIEAQEQIMRLREAALEFQNENLSLKSTVKELKETPSSSRWLGIPEAILRK